MQITQYFQVTDDLYFTIGNSKIEHIVDHDGDVEFEMDTYDGTHYFRCNVEELRELVTAWDNRRNRTPHPDQLSLDL